MNWWTPVISLFKLTFGIDLQNGSSVRSFEKALGELIGKNIQCLPNARYCLLTCLDFLEIGSDDVVLMSPINLPDMATIIRNTEAELQFVPYREKSFEPDYEKCLVPENAKVFFFTPIAGITVDMDRLKEFCRKNNLELFLDLTQAFQVHWKDKYLHEYSDYCFSSLCDLKVIHTHRGGYLMSKNEELIDFTKKKSNRELSKIEKNFFLTSIFEDWISLTLLKPFVFRFFSQYLIKLLTLKKGDNVEAITSGQGVKFMGFRFFKSFFQSNQVQRGIGFPSFLKYRFTDLQAKIGLSRILELRTIENKRISNSKYFYSLLSTDAAELIPKGALMDGATYWKCPLWIKKPLKFKRKASLIGIDCSQTNLPQLNNVEIGEGENMRDNIIYMPTHWYLKRSEIEYLAKFVNDYVKDVS